jgi:ubiquinone/menaquinone biosynthesis C-methylase UbiE
MLEEAESKAARAGVAEIVHTLRADLENDHGSSLKKGTADWTLVANILYQADPAKILNEAARITKQGGTIVVVEWQPAATPLGPPSETRLTKGEVLELAKEAHLSKVKEFEPSPYHYGLLLAA